jgi:hypothetical protein
MAAKKKAAKRKAAPKAKAKPKGKAKATAKPKARNKAKAAAKPKASAAAKPKPKAKPANNKTVATSASVAAYLAKIADPQRRADCERLLALFERVTGETATMWGSAIVGFGTYHYLYETGRAGESCRTGFSSRAQNIALYVGASGPGRDARLARLGPHDTGKGCLYLKRLADVNEEVLAEIIAAGDAHVRATWP